MTEPDDRGDVRATVLRWRSLGRAPTGRRVLVAASFTAQPIAPGLGLALYDSTGAAPHVDFADYNQIFQVCLAPELTANADEVVIVWRIEDMFERDFHAWAEGDGDAHDRLLRDARSLGAAVADLAGRRPGSVVVSDAPTPVGYGLDHGDPELLTQLVDLQRAVNDALDAGLGGAVLDRFRLAALQHHVGTAASFDRRTWLMYRQPFPERFALDVGAGIAEVIAARTRVPPKVVVLDCDDTLWSGVAGDDGIGGLDAGDAFPGFAHRSFQFAVRRLRHRGVLLALASKNDPSTVTQAFAEVDGMVLADADIATRRISWNPKPDAVADIARELNVGLDAIVFVDDSDYEIGAMRTQLPAVRSVQVPDRIEALPDLLAETGWFRMMRTTDDDRARTGRIVAESQRAEFATSMSQAEFLASLDLRVRLVRVGAAELARVTQLVNKTNQFNVTTIRRSEADIAALIADPDTAVYAMSVDDRFGEYGLVGVVIAIAGARAWHLDTLLMSCRVLGRGVESAMLAGVCRDLRSIRPMAITAAFVDSGRNGLVADLFPAHGFDVVGSDGPAVRFVLPADRGIDPPEHISLATP